MKIEMPENANRIINTLEAAGYEAYIVGGCVRDAILGRTPEDWDITTSARPEQVKALFKRTIDTGIQHGTVTVMIDGTGYEVTTYRIDGEYSDHRRPDEVCFTSNLEEDLKRRDFTINAMAYSHKAGIVDIFGGKSDLDNKIIRAVGVAGDRFDEDALRILRAIRFAGQLGFEIERETKAAMIVQAIHLKDISAERIRVELVKLLTSAHPEKLIDAYVMGITSYILPEFDHMMEQPQNNPYHLYNVGVHSIEAVKAIEPTPVCRLAALLHDVGKPETHSVDENGTDHFYGHAEVSVRIAQDVMRRLKFDNESIKTVCKMAKWHDYALSGLPSKNKFRQFLSETGTEFFPLFLKIRKADMAAQSNYRLEEKKEILQGLESMYEEIVKEGDCLTIRDLAIDGSDLINNGMKPGKKMGEVLKYLLNRVLEEP
ncbi:MAG: CCA tRNA nucleotidyltransferase, partial [Coprococcus sp.]